MQPQHVVERHLIFRARPPIGLENLPSGGGSQGVVPPEVQRTRQMLGGNLYFIQLVSKVRSGKGTGKNGHGEYSTQTAASNGDGHEDPAPKWAIEFRDTPEPGKQAATVRLMSRSVVDGGDAVGFVQNLGFEYALSLGTLADCPLTPNRYVSQYVLEGHKFYDQDTTLFLYHVLQVPKATDEQLGEANNLSRVISELQPLDASHGYVLQASIEAVDGNNPDLKDKAVQQLLSMKETLKQAVVLAPGDRLALDTKVSTRNARP